ncbi:hypothetical protein DICVIV_12869 [Dictyocaulus viviparus]|uniref:Uncharacterized protein n=1 Tax=Dictyocaulus viviparus TaxID=29172 RepID=A0A0D8X985_DICVI|nr:hypothetical protein DICVIV_12869 [Dictyocaulus viviparus]
MDSGRVYVKGIVTDVPCEFLLSADNKCRFVELSHISVLNDQYAEPEETVVTDVSDSGDIKDSPYVESEPEVVLRPNKQKEKKAAENFNLLNFSCALETSQTEEVGDENKSLIWTILKQIRPGMDLSKSTKYNQEYASETSFDDRYTCINVDAHGQSHLKCILIEL